jgi:hypothetical protein
MKTERWQKLVCVAYFFISPLLPFGVYYLNRNIDSFVDGFPNFLPIITTFVFFLIGGRLLFIAWKISNKANLITLVIIGMVFSGIGLVYGFLLIFVGV